MAVMHSRVIAACLAAGCSVAAPVLAFSTSAFGVDTASSGGKVSQSRSRDAPQSDTRTRKSPPRSVPWMGQSFNPQAVASITRVVRHPGLAVPHLSLDHIGSLDFKALRDMGCKGIVFDKDNTLTAPYEDEPHPLVKDGLERCMEAFEGRVCIMSNSAGTRDDPGYADAIRIESSMGIPVLRHDDKKPGGVAEVLDFFKSESSDGAEVRLDELCFIGDRLLTDVVFGNLHGMLTVHTQPLTLEGDNRPAAFFRFIEKKVFLDLLHQTWSVEPQPHALCPEGAGVLARGDAPALVTAILPEAVCQDT